MLVVKSPPANEGDKGDMGSTPGLGRSPGKGNGNTLQYSCLENSMDGGAWQAVLHGVAKSQDNLEEMDRFLEKLYLPRLNQNEIEIMNNPITSTEMKL